MTPEQDAPTQGMIPQQRDVVLKLSETSRELDEASRYVAKVDREAVAAAHDYRLAYARAFLEATGSVEERKQKAVLESETQRFAMEVADQQVRAVRDRIRVMRDRLEVGRSLNAAVRSQFAAEPVGQET
ncbi:hypothetical protein ACUH96_00770 [Dermabacteraceae bacterium P13077]